MSAGTLKVALPPHASGENFDGVHLVKAGERALVAYGLKRPREDGEQWFTLEVTRMGARRHDTLSIDLDARGARLLRDALVRLHGLPK